ncbi:bifunctional diaminohydroxyphosphoribosylaminopyrimidine deaminase/5-amino-6-(5-phosphoribosylamino)uracil reductase RibD [candidate division GN15 bacterium]|nr:bifunctional diaminohydroxyphosphoribosylaminopyrimidine deaminase/5-amino-6-(5-phosphoribosylamino)uracil reductase RibD [candidate division GN15 bacterium]
MDRALGLAAKGRGRTSPNPMVGAVLVKDGEIVGEGYHRRAGEDHAEIVALKAAGERARGATLYVTLEPCCHTGRTGPCTDAVIAAGVSRVVYAMRDPDSRVHGRGAKKLRAAGVAVTAGIGGDAARRLNEAYLSYHKLGRPFVTLKTAQSLDGRVATRTGESQWITGKQARVFAHELRAGHDGVVVGMGTVRTDNPSLTVRHVKGRNPYRIVVTSSMRFPNNCTLLEKNQDYRTVVASGQKKIAAYAKRAGDNHLTYWTVRNRRTGRIDLHDLLEQAGTFGLRSLLVEGGATLATEFLREGLVDKVVVISAPALIGAGIDAIGDLKVRSLDHAIRLTDTTVEQRGNDIIVTGYPRKVG